VWARRTESGDFRIGLTHRPRSFLGDILHVELPAAGIEVAADEPIGLVESSCAVFEVVSPVAGVIVEVNPAIESSPEKVSSDPLGEGWLIAVRPHSPGETDALLSGDAYDLLVGDEP
jgi:glycine cleavage system H protein